MNSSLGAKKSTNADSVARKKTHEGGVKQKLGVQKSSKSFSHRYRCQDCDDQVFTTLEGFEKHIRTHVRLPDVNVQRLTRSFILQIKSNSKLSRKQVARKRTLSYIVPKIKTKGSGSLKLTLKRASSNVESSKSFKVVPRKILIGPGDRYSLNGSELGEVKTEDLSQEADWAGSVEGSSEKVLEEGGEVAEKGGEDVPVTATVGEDQEQAKATIPEGEGEEEEEEEEDEESDEDEEEGKESDENEAIEDACRETIEDLKLLEVHDDPIRATPAPTPCLSPTPSEQLGPEFMPPEGAAMYPPSPSMVEMNGSSPTEAPSPAFPTTSPAQPTPPLESQSGLNGDETVGDQQGLENSEQVNCGESADSAGDDGQRSFTWNDMGNSNLDGVTSDGTNVDNMEERDPLMLNEQGPPGSMSTEQGGGMSLDLNHDPGPLEGGDSLLRGFLCEQPPDKTAVPVTNVGSIEGLGLGSEYISLEHLGEGGLYCDVCGDRASDHAGLEEHRNRAGHFKCGHSECGGLVLPTGDELIAHQQNLHGGQPYPQQSMVNHQPAPVQQLAQQVQRLPVPQMSMQQHSPQMVQQMAPQLHPLMPPQQPQFQSPVRRPPPLYRVPAPVSMTSSGMQQHHTSQYAGQSGPPPQHMMYQQPYPGQAQGYPPGQQQMHVRPYSNLMQQINHQQQARPQMSHRMPGPGMAQRVPAPQQQGSPGMKRGPGPGGRGSPNNKQRRMDVLIPDRHDDADCHVIAMQKRTESGPVIGSVQGSAGAATSSASGMIHLTDSITLSVRQPQPGVPNSAPVTGKNKSDAKAVANILATRGITVTPAGGTGRGNGQGQQNSPQRVNRAPAVQPPVPAPPVATLNLNTAISIIPTASGRQPARQQPQQQQQQQGGGGFAVPHGRSPNRSQQQSVERPPRPPTVDLTGDGPSLSHHLPMRMRGRGRGGMVSSGRHTCQVCDKAFSTQESLSQHMLLHRSPGKLPYRCNLCSAQYPTQQGLLQHRQTYHKEPGAGVSSGTELALPVVDLKHPGTLGRLANLGVQYYLPLSQLQSQSNGYFGLPIVALDGGRAPVCTLAGLGTSTVLSLGPIKPLPR